MAPSISRHSIGGVIAAMLTLLIAACGGGTPSTSSLPAASDSASALPTPSPSPSSEPELSRIALPVEPGSTVEGLVDVDGHDIYARCAGDGSPTVVYFTGWAGDPGDPPKLATEIAVGIENALGPSIRVCSYDRRNMGRSQAVDGVQAPHDLIADVDGVLEALGEDGPFVLLGASFGGLVSSAYAVAHPGRVAGVVLLDASTGVDYEIDEMGGFQGACLPSNRELDANASLERVDNCRLSKWISDRRDREPDVPLLFLASAETPYGGPPLDLIMEWVDSWSPGEWRVVQEPHHMDESNTELVADAVREVIDLSQ